MSDLSTRRAGIKQSLGFLVLRSQRLMAQQLERAFAAVGVTIQQHVGLQLLYEGLANGPSDIAKVLGLDTGSGTRLVDQLAEKGFVTRLREGADRRAVTLALTPEGRAAAEASQAASQAYADTLLAGYEDAEVKHLQAALSGLVARLEERTDG